MMVIYGPIITQRRVRGSSFSIAYKLPGHGIHRPKAGTSYKNTFIEIIEVICAQSQFL